jgi:cyanate permease
VVNAVAAAGIPAAILAHQGGWDEMLLVIGPIALVAGLLWLARRRVTRAEHDPDDAHPSMGGRKT